MIKVALIDPLDGRAVDVTDAGKISVSGILGAIPVDLPQTTFGWNAIRKFGFNQNVPTAGEIIWDLGTTPYPGFFTTPQQTEVVSTSPSDSAGGIGMQRIMVEGLDAEWKEQSFAVDLNGTTPVPIDGNKVWLRGFRMFSVRAGSNGVNVGNISWQVAGGGTIFAAMQAERGQTLMAIYTVPVGYERAYLAKWKCGITRNQATYGEVELVTRTFGEGTRVRDIIGVNSQGNTQEKQELSPWIELPPRTDIIVNVAESGAAAAYNGGFTVFLIGPNQLP